VLPAELTTFVGRRHELAEAKRLLSTGRMVTLTGFGGVGKTRLAVRITASVRRAFPDGVWFVDLTALNDPQLLATTVANTLELRQVSSDPAADLAAYLEDRQLLLVLDNCEHLTDACAILASKLLAAAPRLHILATSRHVLGVEGEQILSVPPLSTPEADAPPGDVSHYEAVELFIDRASAVAPDFTTTETNRPVIIELCRKLDGIPLAIELAAVWLRTLSPAQILARLEDRFRLLSGGRRAGPMRQQALEAAVGWSHDLCSPGEQLMWARLSVFSGGFDLDAAEAVCEGSGVTRDDVLSLVAGLVNKSVVTRQPATDESTAWYHMLETVRQYGAAQLSPDEERRLRTRHLEHYRALAADYGEHGFGPHQADWFLRLRREHGNLRTALDFCLEDPVRTVQVFEIAAPIWNFWFAGFLREGYGYLLRALDVATEPTASRAHALWAASYLAMFATEFDRHATMLAECESIAANLGDPLLEARIKECRGHATVYQGDLPRAVEILEAACAEFRAIGDALGEFDSLILLTAATLFLDDDRVDDFSRQALELADRHGALSSRGYGLWSVGVARWRAGAYADATRLLRESVRLFLPMHDLTGVSFGVQGLSWCAALESPDTTAARLLGAAQAVWRTSGAKVDETNAYGMFDERAEVAVRRVIGSARFEEAFAEGASYSFEQAVSAALGSDRESSSRRPRRSPQPGGAGGLTPREREVALLLADGLSNREIADRLVISLRTAETHVDHILRKLGLTSRARVAGWAAVHLRPPEDTT
jgi:predicted ATPase/DNA-binding CsgD family transcriptional regulator